MKVNLYDFDGTIYDGDSTIDFYLFCLKKQKSLIKYLPYQALYLLLYLIKIVNKDKYKQAFFIFLKDLKDIDSDITSFWKTNKNKIKKWYKKKNHVNDIIISASPIFLLKPITQELKTKDLIATDIDKKSGKLISKNCKGIEKIEQLNKKYKDLIIEEAYTDSDSDKPIIDIAKKGYFVKKDKIFDFKDHPNSEKKELIMYLIIGITTTLINLVTYYIFINLIFKNKSDTSILITNIIAWIVAVIYAYVTNKKLVFDQKKSKLNFKEFYLFVGSRVLTLLLEITFMYILLKVFKLNDMIVKVLVQGIVIVVNYIISKFYIFKK